MADITVSVNDERFVVPATEPSSAFVAGFLSKVNHNDLLRALGSTAEKQQGFMTVPNIEDWFARLQNPIQTVVENGTNDADATSPAYQSDVAPATANGVNPRWPNGPDGQEWEHEWYSVHNYLKYGGSAIVAGTGETQNTTSSKQTLINLSENLDCIFGSQGNSANNFDLADIANTRTDTIAILGASFNGDSVTYLSATGSTSGLTGIGGVTQSQYTFLVPGTKYHLKTSQNVNVDKEFNLLQESFLTADAAGCFARTMSGGRSFKSPAGMDRGKILDVVKIGKVVSDSEYDVLYNMGFNPVRTFPEGSFLFGDKTGEAIPKEHTWAGQDAEDIPNDSFNATQLAIPVLTRVNVVRTFLYLKNIIGQSARNYLFEINDAETRQAFISTIEPTLTTVQNGRGISEFKIVCDQTNNPQSVIDANEFVVDVFIKPLKSINFIRLRFTNKDSGESVLEG